MCFDLDSLPPIAPIAGAAVSHADLSLRAADGTAFAAFEAVPESPGPAGIVILPDVRGLYRFYEELALRFAELGHRAVAFDYFGRTAGAEKRDDEFDFWPHVKQTSTAGVQADVAAVIAHLREAGCSRVYTVGFCFGGSHAWLAAAEQEGLAGAVGFYGRPGERNGEPGPTQRAAELDAPILALMGGADEGIPPEAVEEFRAALQSAGAEHEIVVYEGAPHSFFDRKQEQFAEASDDAWQRVLAFIGG
jgi:carboxymethylenebutenolidase